MERMRRGFARGEGHQRGGETRERRQRAERRRVTQIREDERKMEKVSNQGPKGEKRRGDDDDDDEIEEDKIEGCCILKGREKLWSVYLPLSQNPSLLLLAWSR